MSATSPDSVDIREQIVRIDRAIAETRKFQAETDKLLAEARNFGRQGYIQAALAVSGIAGGILAIIQFALHLKGA